jgi:hypothetical protein
MKCGAGRQLKTAFKYLIETRIVSLMHDVSLLESKIDSDIDGMVYGPL